MHNFNLEQLTECRNYKITDRRKTDLCNFMYKRKSNKALLQTRQLRTFLLNTIVTTRPLKIV